jgi:2-methylcitrate dehydratase PrpD
MKDVIRKALYLAVLTLVSLVPLARAQVEESSNQKKKVAMPEASSPAVLAADLVSVGALILLVRRREASKNR